MADVTLTHLGKVYAGHISAVHDINATIHDGEFMVLVGPSGCGKSTLLRMIAGLEEITEGTVHIGGRLVNDVLPKDRDIAMVFQNYALYPDKTVYENMAFCLQMRDYESVIPPDDGFFGSIRHWLKARREKRAFIDKKVRETAELLQIQSLLDRRPKALSGGQRQRVALGRCIVRNPSVFLFDEPLSNLDAKMRVQMRAEISRLHQRLKATMIYVTHDQTEAMTMGDRIIVMKDGIVQQIDTPTAIYDSPANAFVAGFIGTPPMNFFNVSIRSTETGFSLIGSSFALQAPDSWVQTLRTYDGKTVLLGIRPEHIGSPLAESQLHPHYLNATVDFSEPMGAETYLFMKTGADEFIARVEPHRPCPSGASLSLAVMLEKAHLFDIQTTQRIL